MRKVKKPKKPRLESKLRKNRLLTIKELSEYLDLAEITVYRLAQRGELPGIKIGKSWRFRKARVNEWIRKNEKEA
jgi:excisionase family DNA binding protein